MKTKTTKFNCTEAKQSSIVCFAPNASYPPRHGGAVRSVRLFEEFVNITGGRASMIGNNFTISVEGRIRFYQNQMNREVTSLEGAARSLIFQEHYLKAKQMSSRIMNDFLREVARLQPKIVLLNYLYSSSLLPYLRNQQVFIETHNDDWEWFKNFKDGTSNPLKKWICWNSLQKTDAYMEQLTSNVTLVHVSERDKDAYKKSRPDLKHLVVPNGCDPKPRTSTPSNEVDPIRLVFVGSLSSNMNVEAIDYFAEKFWPLLKNKCVLTIGGSNPSQSIEANCKKYDWELRANLSDEELDGIYTKAHFAILPFAYGCGSKLKLAEACGRGLPILSTRAGVTGIEPEVPRNVMVSDRAEDWVARIQQPAVTNESVEAALKFAEDHSWEQSASIFLKYVQSDGKKTVRTAS